MGMQLPVIGEWFKDAIEGQAFEVVATDDRLGTIEIQYQDGSIAEFDTDSWLQLQLSPAVAPEDASASYEMAPEDRWGSDVANAGFAFNPVSALEPESFTGTEDF